MRTRMISITARRPSTPLPIVSQSQVALGIPIADGVAIRPPPSHPLGMNLRYETSRQITADEFIDLLRRSTLAERRPVDDRKCMEAMLHHANLLCTAWDGEKLVGVGRSVTDFDYCCYLSDLAVDESYQKRGIGKELIRLTASKLGDKAKIILLAAPKAEAYYPKLGFESHGSAWILPASKPPQ
jgi:predicted N-acetyltransferase YhbS